MTTSSNEDLFIASSCSRALPLKVTCTRIQYRRRVHQRPLPLSVNTWQFRHKPGMGFVKMSGRTPRVQVKILQTCRVLSTYAVTVWCPVRGPRKGSSRRPPASRRPLHLIGRLSSMSPVAASVALFCISAMSNGGQANPIFDFDFCDAFERCRRLLPASSRLSRFRRSSCP